MLHLRRTLAVAATLLTAYACSSDTGANDIGEFGGVGEPTGEISVALAQVPSGVGCIVLTALPPSATDPLIKRVSVTPGAPTSFSMSGIPTGRVVFRALAYGGTCPPSSTATALWVSRPTGVDVFAGLRTSLTLVMEKPGQVDVIVDFPDGGPSQCPAGTFVCRKPDGTPTACSDHLTDMSNCGQCGNRCDDRQKCVNGQCLVPNPCPAGQFICTKPDGTPGACSDHMTDMSNCGQCGNRCDDRQKCVNGQCLVPNPCPAGQFICTKPDGTPTACSDHLTDMSNCGQCGNRCDDRQKCVDGQCLVPNPCPAGEFICRKADGTPTACSNHLTDMLNCGQCGNRCNDRQICVNGVCQ